MKRYGCVFLFFLGMINACTVSDGEVKQKTQVKMNDYSDTMIGIPAVSIDSLNRLSEALLKKIEEKKQQIATLENN